MQVVVTASSLAHLPAIAALFTPFAGRTSGPRGAPSGTKGPLGELDPLQAQGLEVVSGPTVSR